MMKKLILLFIFSFFAVNSAYCASLNAGVRIPIVFPEEVSSNYLKSNQEVKIEAAQEVAFADTVFFEKGSKGVLYPYEVLPARKFAKGGRIKFNDKYSSGYLIDTNGNPHAIALKKEYKGKRITIINIISSVMVWNPIGWALLWIKGKPAVIPADSGEIVTLMENVIIQPLQNTPNEL